MASENFDKSLTRILVYEGGNDDDPQDPGGRTSRGIIQSEYNVWRRKHGQPPRDVWSASDQEIHDIYRASYWDAMRCDDLPSGLDLVAFDSGVNSGVGQAAKWFQRALGCPVTGRWDAATFSAIAADVDNDRLIGAILEKRLDMLRGLRTFGRFGRGWTDRVNSVKKIAQSWASGSVGPDAATVTQDGGHKKTGKIVRPSDELTDYEVRAIQQALTDLGYPLGKIDGDWGGLTKGAAARFQKDHDLDPSDGEYSQDFRAALDLASRNGDRAVVSDARANATADDLRAAKSTTVAAGDGISTVGKILAFFGISGLGADGVTASGLVDMAGSVKEKSGAIKEAIETATDLGGFVAGHWWVLALAGGVAAIWYGRQVIEARLADHRSGANTNR